MRPQNPLTLGLDRPHDVANDLLWVLTQLEEDNDLDAAARLCRIGAFLAWHLHDWVWREVKDRLDIRAKLMSTLGRPRKKMQKNDFVAYILSKSGCPNLQYCEMIATASKHTDIDRAKKGEGPEIQIYGSPVHKARWKIRTEGEIIYVEAVLEEAYNFWYSFIVEHRLDPDSIGQLHPDAENTSARYPNRA